MSDPRELVEAKKKELRARAEKLAEELGDNVQVSALARALELAYLEGMIDGLKAMPPFPSLGARLA